MINIFKIISCMLVMGLWNASPNTEEYFLRVDAFDTQTNGSGSSSSSSSSAATTELRVSNCAPRQIEMGASSSSSIADRRRAFAGAIHFEMDPLVVVPLRSIMASLVKSLVLANRVAVSGLSSLDTSIGKPIQEVRLNRLLLMFYKSEFESHVAHPILDDSRFRLNGWNEEDCVLRVSYVRDPIKNSPLVHIPQTYRQAINMPNDTYNISFRNFHSDPYGQVYRACRPTGRFEGNACCETTAKIASACLMSVCVAPEIALYGTGIYYGAHALQQPCSYLCFSVIPHWTQTALNGISSASQTAWHQCLNGGPIGRCEHNWHELMSCNVGMWGNCIGLNLITCSLAGCAAMAEEGGVFACCATVCLCNLMFLIG